MKYKYLLLLICSPIFMATQCNRSTFFPDPDDPGLSRFTSRGTNVASAYINNDPYLAYASNYNTLLSKDSTGNSIDTLKFALDLSPHSGAIYQNISFQIPVSATFNKSDLLAFNGQRFLNPTRVVIKDISLNSISGSANLYFVSVTENLSFPPQKYIRLSGLFNGNIGDSVNITKGRFDFDVNENNLNF